MKPSHMLWRCFMKIRNYNRACSMLRQIPLLQPSSHPSRSVRISRWLATPASTPMLTIHNRQKSVTAISTPTSVMKKTTSLLHQGARKWSKKRKAAKNTIQKTNFLWIHSSCLLSLTQGSSCVIKKDTKNPLQIELAVKSPLMASTPTASSSGCFTIPPRNPPRRSEVQFVRRTVKSKIQWTPTNG